MTVKISVIIFDKFDIHAVQLTNVNPLWLEIIHILTFFRGLVYTLRMKRFNLFFTYR